MAQDGSGRPRTAIGGVNLAQKKVGQLMKIPDKLLTNSENFGEKGQHTSKMGPHTSKLVKWVK